MLLLDNLILGEIIWLERFDTIGLLKMLVIPKGFSFN